MKNLKSKHKLILCVVGTVLMTALAIYLIIFTGKDSNSSDEPEPTEYVELDNENDTAAPDELGDVDLDSINKPNDEPSETPSEEPTAAPTIAPSLTPDNSVIISDETVTNFEWEENLEPIATTTAPDGHTVNIYDEKGHTCYVRHEKGNPEHVSVVGELVIWPTDVSKTFKLDDDNTYTFAGQQGISPNIKLKLPKGYEVKDATAKQINVCETDGTTQFTIIMNSDISNIFSSRNRPSFVYHYGKCLYTTGDTSSITTFGGCREYSDDLKSNRVAMMAAGESYVTDLQMYLNCDYEKSEAIPRASNVLGIKNMKQVAGAYGTKDYICSIYALSDKYSQEDLLYMSKLIGESGTCIYDASHYKRMCVHENKTAKELDINFTTIPTGWKITQEDEKNSIYEAVEGPFAGSKLFLLNASAIYGAEVTPSNVFDLAKDYLLKNTVINETYDTVNYSTQEKVIEFTLTTKNDGAYYGDTIKYEIEQYILPKTIGDKNALKAEKAKFIMFSTYAQVDKTFLAALYVPEDVDYNEINKILYNFIEHRFLYRPQNIAS